MAAAATCIQVRRGRHVATLLSYVSWRSAYDRAEGGLLGCHHPVIMGVWRYVDPPSVGMG